MKNFILGGIITYGVIYCIGCTYLLTKGVRKNVRGC